VAGRRAILFRKISGLIRGISSLDLNQHDIKDEDCRAGQNNLAGKERKDPLKKSG